MSKQSGIISNRKVEALHPATLKGRGFTAGQGKSERNNGLENFEFKNNHPTVKPIELMKYLCRLITPIDGTVLDPFLGSGSTGVAALMEEFNFVGIEKEANYLAIAKQRISNVCEEQIQQELF